ncbi:MAG: Membrane-bound lytic murein transglycosylase A precursor [Syntrophus sp. PtaB.Bin001]|nr:MAG: Membrane-bound lytic murein transglycosylase A precursor [Syntrophus sp. PtaB.Bin001]
MKTRTLLVIGLIFVMSAVGCQKPRTLILPPPEPRKQAEPKLLPPETQKKDYSKQLPPGELSLRKIIDPADIPDFTAACNDLSGLKKAINNSLNYLKKPSSKKFFPYGEITHKQAEESLQVFAKLIDAGYEAAELNDLIREQFDVYISVGCDDQGTVLYTGYFTPIFYGSTKPDDRFKYPLYGPPEDLVKENGVTLGRKTDEGISTYPSRAEIESSGMLKGREIIWLADPFEVYIAHAQGSAKIRQPDGSLIGIGYAANNGHEYKSVALQMVADGKISRDQMSMSKMIAYFKAHPDEVSKYTRLNPRFVFFRIIDGPPRGTINEPVTALRTIATDKSIYPRACLAFISTTLPRANGSEVVQAPYSGFALDQDSGGAIRAPGRCDVYMGQGDEAGRLAGSTYREGRLYYLFLKPEYQQKAILKEKNLD